MEMKPNSLAVLEIRDVPNTPHIALGMVIILLYNLNVVIASEP